MPGDVDAATNPDPIVFFNMVKEALQGTETSWAAKQAAMHTDAQHRRPFLAFGVHDVEGIAQILEEFVTCLLYTSRCV